MLMKSFCAVTMAAVFSLIIWTESPAFAQEIMSSPPASSKLAESYKKVSAKLAQLEESLGRCADLKDRGVRMTCYDHIVEGIGYMTPEKVSENEKKLDAVGFWQISQKESLDGTKQTYLRVESSNKIESQSGTERQPVLVIRCTPGKTDVFLDWKAPVTMSMRESASAKALVTYYTNSSEQLTEDWEVSTDKYALFSLDSVTFIRNLMNQKKLTMKFAPEGMSMKTVFFDISGVETAINTIVKSCY